MDNENETGLVLRVDSEEFKLVVADRIHYYNDILKTEEAKDTYEGYMECARVRDIIIGLKKYL
jgi:hypothetical protein